MSVRKTTAMLVVATVLIVVGVHLARTSTDGADKATRRAERHARSCEAVFRDLRALADNESARSSDTRDGGAELCQPAVGNATAAAARFIARAGFWSCPSARALDGDVAAAGVVRSLFWRLGSGRAVPCRAAAALRRLANEIGAQWISDDPDADARGREPNVARVAFSAQTRWDGIVRDNDDDDAVGALEVRLTQDGTVTSVPLRMAAIYGQLRRRRRHQPREPRQPSVDLCLYGAMASAARFRVLWADTRRHVVGPLGIANVVVVQFDGGLRNSTRLYNASEPLFRMSARELRQNARDLRRVIDSSDGSVRLAGHVVLSFAAFRATAVPPMTTPIFVPLCDATLDVIAARGAAPADFVFVTRLDAWFWSAFVVAPTPPAAALPVRECVDGTVVNGTLLPPKSPSPAVARLELRAFPEFSLFDIVPKGAPKSVERAYALPLRNVAPLDANTAIFHNEFTGLGGLSDAAMLLPRAVLSRFSRRVAQLQLQCVKEASFWNAESMYAFALIDTDVRVAVIDFHVVASRRTPLAFLRAVPPERRCTFMKCNRSSCKPLPRPIVFGDFGAACRELAPNVVDTREFHQY
jgi:hypothetical protein